MLLAKDWKDYKILDTGCGLKLENIKDYILIRPDSQIIWDKEKPDIWIKAQNLYHRNDKGGGYWEFRDKIKNNLFVEYKKLKFYIDLTNFKHISLFPEQAVNWDFIIDSIKKEKKDIKILNLFAYTGGATIASIYGGASEVVHVDASKKAIELAKKNILLNSFENKIVRFIYEDVFKFVKREIRRGRKYDGIIMDPPVYGRGPNGELWQIETNLTLLVKECLKLLSDKPIFFIINSYTSIFSHIAIKNMLLSTIKPQNKGIIESGEIGIPIHKSNISLPCGIFARWHTF